jgi:hypothetical protein
MKFINPDKVFLIATIICNSLPPVCNSLPVKGFVPSLSQRSRPFVHHGIPHHAAASTTFEYVATDPKNEFAGSVKFPPPLNKVDRLKRAATFWVSTVPILSNYYANLGRLQFLEMHGMTMPIEESEVCCAVYFEFIL